MLFYHQRHTKTQENKEDDKMTDLHEEMRQEPITNVTYQTYMSDKMAFIKKHGDEWTLDTSPLDEYGRYMKTYIFEDGAVFYELMGKVVEEVEVRHRGLSFKVQVEMYRTEYWSTEFCSRFIYEKY